MFPWKNFIWPIWLNFVISNICTRRFEIGRSELCYHAGWVLESCCKQTNHSVNKIRRPDHKNYMTDEFHACGSDLWPWLIHVPDISYNTHGRRWSSGNALLTHLKTRKMHLTNIPQCILTEMCSHVHISITVAYRLRRHACMPKLMKSFWITPLTLTGHQTDHIREVCLHDRHSETITFQCVILRVIDGNVNVYNWWLQLPQSICSYFHS